MSGEVVGPEPLVSVVVNNYNYARFLPGAIESALGQSYPRVEVVVVDDGSTDDSRVVIASYGGRVVPVLKANGGQLSTFAAGLARASGEVVIFLDADDLLLPDIAARTAAVFRTCPEAAKVQWRLAVADAAGRPSGALKPSGHLRMPSGDLRPEFLGVLEYTWPPTSGNAFAAHVLRRVLPGPEAVYRHKADEYVNLQAALFGPIVSLDSVGTLYRIHGSNNHFKQIEPAAIRQDIERFFAYHAAAGAAAAELGLTDFPAWATEVSNVHFLCKRMLSYKLDRARHPIVGDTLVGLAARGVAAALGHPYLTPQEKALNAAWFGATAAAPRGLARWLGAQLIYPERREPLNRLLGALRGGLATERELGRPLVPVVLGPPAGREDRDHHPVGAGRRAGGHRPAH